VEEGVNLAAYTSASNAADVNDLRLALGYSEWNLSGVSYGTRLALTVLRDFPGGVRRVILDSVYPPQVDLYAEKARDAERAFNLLFDLCAADSECNAAYPELKTFFYDTVAQLDAEPITLTLIDSRTGDRYDVVLNGDCLVNILFAILYATEAIPSLPRTIYELHDGKVNMLQRMVQRGIFGDYSEGMSLSISCGEEASFSSPQTIATADAAVLPRIAKTFEAQSYSDLALCTFWGAKPAADIENQPVISDIPTLILAGNNDPITPPAWGKLAAETLSRSYFFEFQGVGHGVLYGTIWDGCSQDMLRAFLTDPSLAPDSACLAEKKVTFVTK
jgi:pimeloyl-ACP methyl ester carboxylesterase